MRNYELVAILKPDLDKEKKEKLAKKIEQIIKKLKGKVKKQEDWGKKDLAYPIKKLKQGIYLKFSFQLPEKKVKQWREKIELEENIIRHLLIKRK